MKSKILILLFVFSTISYLAYPQKWKLAREEYMYGIGTVNYFGDIGGAEDPDASSFADIDIANTRPGLSVGYRYRILDRVAAKASFSYLNFHGSDVGSQNEARNYSFTTNMYELYGHVEYHITPEKQIIQYSKMSLRGSLEKFNAGLNVYVFAGLSAGYFKPKALDNLDGSGRFVDNKNFVLTFPVGIGLKYPLTVNTFIGFELSGRFTTSDYLDGFAPDNPANKRKDLYYSSVIYVSHKIKRNPNNKRKFRF